MDGKIGEIILPGFAHPYNIGNLMVFFQQVQQLRNSLKSDESIEHQTLKELFKTMPVIDNVQYLCTAQEPFEQIAQAAREQDRGLLDGSYKDIKTLLINILSGSLPEEGHTIVCPVNEGGGHWCFMTIFNNGHEIFYSYNDPAGTPMRPVLREAIESNVIQAIADSLGKTTRITDHQKEVKVDCTNPCGIGAIISGYILSKNPLEPKLEFGHINELQSHFYRIFHVMTDGALWSNYQTLEEKIMLLYIIDQVHSQNPGVDRLIGAAQSLFKYLEPNTQCDPTTLSQLKSTLDYKFATSDWTLNSFGSSFLEGLQAAKGKMPSTPLRDEAAGGGAEEQKESADETLLLKKYNLGDGYELHIYQNGVTNLMFQGNKCQLIIEQEKGEMQGQIFETPITGTNIGVLWVSDEPHLTQPDTLDYVMVEETGNNS